MKITTTIRGSDGEAFVLEHSTERPNLGAEKCSGYIDNWLRDQFSCQLTKSYRVPGQLELAAASPVPAPAQRPPPAAPVAASAAPAPIEPVQQPGALAAPVPPAPPAPVLSPSIGAAEVQQPPALGVNDS